MNNETVPGNVPLSEGLGLGAEAHWYCVSRGGMATLCADEQDAMKVTAESNASWPNNSPHRAVQLVEARMHREAVAEIARLTIALTTANNNAERFERGWYLRGDALEELEQWTNAYPLKVFPEPQREEWQRAAALLSEKGLSLDRISASNMRHVIKGVREIVAVGLKA